MLHLLIFKLLIYFDFFLLLTVRELAQLLHSKLSKCISGRSKIEGINRESSQAAFFQLMTTGVPEITAVTGDHRLTMWLCNCIFPHFYTKTPSSETVEIAEMSDVEKDISHYIGGFVCSKLKSRAKGECYKEVVDCLISVNGPDPNTLIGAKTRGLLTSLNKDARCLFVELERIFRATFTSNTSNINFTTYKVACYNQSIVQDCFHNATGHTNNDCRDQVLSDIIFFYFKVRIHHKCKVYVEKIRAEKSTSQKERALRSKLAH